MCRTLARSVCTESWSVAASPGALVCGFVHRIVSGIPTFTKFNYICRLLQLSSNRTVKIIFSLMLFCVALPTAFAQGNVFTDILRSVTGTVGRGDAPAAPKETSVLGVRGMDEDEVKASSGPVSDGVKLIESWAVGRREAEAAASRRGLVARSVEYEKDATDSATPQGSQ